MIRISKSYQLICEYDGDKPDQIEIPELNLVLRKGNWLIKIEGCFLVCDDITRFALYGDAYPIVNPEAKLKKDIGQMVNDSVKAVIKKDQDRCRLLVRSKDDQSLTRQARPSISINIQWPKL